MGKTTLLEKLVPEITARGLTVSLIKHSHKSIDIDRPGKDSYHIRASGCHEVLLLGHERWALMHELRGAPEPSLEELLPHMQDCDLVLIEGFRGGGCAARAEVWREEAWVCRNCGRTGRASWPLPATPAWRPVNWLGSACRTRRPLPASFWRTPAHHERLGQGQPRPAPTGYDSCDGHNGAQPNTTRNTPMQRRPLGQSGLQVSPLCFGGNVFGWTVDQADSFELLDAWLDAGFNFIDTANVYSRWVAGNTGGESETIIGNWLKQSGKRHQVVLATKVGKDTFEGAPGCIRGTSGRPWKAPCSGCRPITSTCTSRTTTTPKCRWKTRWVPMRS